MTLLVVGIIVFVIVISITGFLWRTAKKMAVILIIVVLIGSFGTNSYANSIKEKVIIPLEKTITNVDGNTIKNTQEKFKNSLGVLSSFASVKTIKNDKGKFIVEFKIFNIVIKRTEVKQK